MARKRNRRSGHRSPGRRNGPEGTLAQAGRKGQAAGPTACHHDCLRGFGGGAHWEGHLKHVFGEKAESSSIAGFVWWNTPEEGKPLAIVVWNGPPESVYKHYVYAHEPAHVLDTAPDTGKRLSTSQEWASVLSVERSEILTAIYDNDLPNSLHARPSEALAVLLALGWISPGSLWTTKRRILGYFQHGGLVHGAALPHR